MEFFEFFFCRFVKCHLCFYRCQPWRWAACTGSNAVEIDLLKRPMGKQDAYPAAYGGLNKIAFNMDGSVSVTAVNMKTEDFELLDRSLCLVFSGKTRKSSDVLLGQVASTKSNDNHQELSVLKEQVQEFVDLLEHKFSLDRLGGLLSSAWEKKKGGEGYQFEHAECCV